MFLRLPSCILNLDHLHSVTPDPADPTRVALAIDHAGPKPPKLGGKGKGPALPGGFEVETKEILILSGTDAAAVLRFFGERGGPANILELTPTTPTTPTSP